MIMLSDLLLESERLKNRASRDNKPVDARRLAILTGAEVITAEDAGRFLPEGGAITAYIADLEARGEPGAVLVDTGMAARDAIILVNACAESTEGRTLIALALANCAIEPPRGQTVENVRMVVITLPQGGLRDKQGQVTYDAGPMVRHDRGADLNFRPVAEAAVQRLAMSLLINAADIRTTAEWTGAGTEDGRIERLSAMLATRAGIPGDWTEDAVRKQMGTVLQAQKPAHRQSVA